MDIVLDTDGNIKTSRCIFRSVNFNVNDVDAQVNLLEEHDQVTARQPINQGSGRHSFFTYDDLFMVIAFYQALKDEIILTTLLAIFAVTFVVLVFMPHWTASLYVFSLSSILYIDLLGVMRSQSWWHLCFGTAWH